MNNSKVVLRISFALALLSATLILFAYTFGFMPDEEKAELDARASIAESLAVQLIADAGNNDLISLRQTINEVVSRNPDVLSIAMRRNGAITIVQAGDHAKHWKKPEDGKSTATHVFVPILNAQSTWGTLEIVFVPLPKSIKYFGVPVVIIILAGFLATSGLVGNFVVLRRSLKQLDPSSVVPERVQKAFDTLAEGVLILDDRGTILLSNASFTNEINQNEQVLLGKKASDLPWENANSKLNPYPWESALREGSQIVGAPLNIVKNNGDMQKFTVNATRILDAKEKTTGVIVTFDDVTALEFKNAELSQLVARLKEKETEIKLKNNELHFLATRDPLTNCLNRRAFFDSFQKGIEQARANKMPVYCLMMDLDHFKSVNDTFGHAVGDEVIVLMADILNAACRDSDLAGRYGGEEFCIALFGLTQENSFKVAERIRLAITARSREISALENAITTSIGMVKMSEDITDPSELVLRADEALYAAKSSGRNRIVDWKDLPLQEDSSNAESQLPIPIDHQDNKDEASTPSREAKMTIVDPSQKSQVEKQFLENVSISIERAQRNGTIVAVLYISINCDYQIREDQTDAMGQDIVAIIAERLSGLLRSSDHVSVIEATKGDASISKFASDTLAVHIADLQTIDPVIWITKRLTRAIMEPVVVANQEVKVSCQIGVGQFPADGEDASKILQNARSAQSYSKLNHEPNMHMFYSKQVTDYSYQQIAIDHEIRLALGHNKMEMLFQPVLNFGNHKIDMLEAQLHVPSVAMAQVTSSQLMSVAERSGLIHDLSNWIFTRVVSQISSWEKTGLDNTIISINLTTTQLSNKRTMAGIIRILEGSGSLANKILLNILDNARTGNRNTITAAISQIRKTGVQLAIDNIGFGSLTLDDITKLRPDFINIDAAEVAKITEQTPINPNIVAVLAISQTLAIPAIAKGVGNLVQQDQLVALNCDYAQGLALCPPLNQARLGDWLQLFAQKSASYTPTFPKHVKQ